MGELLVFSKNRNDLIREAIADPPDDRALRTIDRLLAAAEKEKVSITFLFLRIDDIDGIRSRCNARKFRDLTACLLDVLLDKTPEGVYVDCLDRNEFLLVMPGVTKENGSGICAQISDRFQTAASDIFKKEKAPPAISGVLVFFPEDVQNRIDLISAGREALHLTQQAGGGRIVQSIDAERHSFSLTGPALQWDRLAKLAVKENRTLELLLCEAVDDLLKKYS
ncbi:MAG: hypothetical protein AB1656_14565 [Candidatus Omnitrophota bacterium]